MCCLYMGFNLTILTIRPELFVCYTESAAAQIDHFINAFVLKNVVCCFDAVMML